MVINKNWLAHHPIAWTSTFVWRFSRDFRNREFKKPCKGIALFVWKSLSYLSGRIPPSASLGIECRILIRWVDKILKNPYYAKISHMTLLFCVYICQNFKDTSKFSSLSLQKIISHLSKNYFFISFCLTLPSLS